jgi:hypothetical protein
VPKATGMVWQVSLVNWAIQFVFLKFKYLAVIFENSGRYIFSKKKLDKSCPIFNSLHAGILGFA